MAARWALTAVLFFSLLACSGSKRSPAAAGAPPPEGTASEPTPEGTTSAPTPDWRVIGRADSKTRCEKLDRPQVISRQEARYPPDVRRRRIEGTVILESVVSSDGIPKQLRVLQSSDANLTDLAFDAFGSWRYKPALCDGEPIETYVTATFSFRLDR